jgi:hypothetical protein
LEADRASDTDRHAQSKSALVCRFGWKGEQVSEPTDNEILAAMRKYGGGFVIALTHAARCADDENLRRIKATWPEYWEQYSNFARMDREKREKGEL